MTEHIGSCLCGAVKFSAHGEFHSFYLCHCQFCQKDSGSAHAANLFAQPATLTWLASPDAVTVFSLPQTRHKKSFCKQCGSPLPTMHDTGLLAIPAGCLDSGIYIEPTAHLFTASKAAWDHNLEALPAFDALPT